MKNPYEDEDSKFRTLEIDDEYETPYFEIRKINELKEMHKKLARLKSKDVKDEKLKIKLAEVCYDVVQDTMLDRIEIIDRAYILSSFEEFNFDDELDDVFGKTIVLVPPENNSPSKIFETWAEIEELLRKYLKDRGVEVEEYI